MEARAVPVAARRVNDITLIGNDFGRTLDPVVHLALEDDPELGAPGVEESWLATEGGQYGSDHSAQICLANAAARH